MKTFAGLLLLITALPVLAEPLVPTPAQQKPTVAAVTAAPTAASAAAVVPAVPTVSSGQLLEQRRQQELVANAEKIDKANRDLLAQNQQLELQNENLGIQVKVLQGDRSSEGIRNGALAVFAGLFVGWLIFRGGGRNKGGW